MNEVNAQYLKSEFWRWVKEHNNIIPKREDMKIKDGYPNSKIYCDFLNITDRKWKEVLDFVGAVRPRTQHKRREYKYDNYTAQDLINIVKNRAKELNNTPKQTDFGGKHNLISASAIIDNLGFNKWNEVLKLCELGATKERNYNKEDALHNLKIYIEKLGYVPIFSEMKRIKYKPSMTWFTNTFGSYETALNMIGYNTILTNDDLLKILKDFYVTNGKSPSTKDMKNANGLPSTQIYYDRFNTSSWNEILKLAELDINWVNYDNTYGEEYALDKLRWLYNTIGRVPQSPDFKKYKDVPSEHYYINKYGGIINSLYKAGVIERPLSQFERINISVKVLIDLSNELHRCPTVNEFDSVKHRGLRRRELERKLGMKYNNICRKYLDYNVNNSHDISKEEIIEVIASIKELIGRPPMFKELKEYGCGYSQSMFFGKFGFQYNTFIKSLGWVPSGSDTLKRTEEQMLDDFNEYFLEIGRIPTLNEITSRTPKIASYSTYITYFGSIENICDLLDIDYKLYYTGKLGTGRIAFDKRGEICRSTVEKDISNYLIDNEFIFDKETKYKDVVPIITNQRMDWTIYTNHGIYYVEYFGMYNRNSNKSINKNDICKKYFKKVKRKIKIMYKFGLYSNCIFIFPYDVENKTMDEIFKNIY